MQVGTHLPGNRLGLTKPWSFSARDVEGYEALMQKLLADNANVRRYRTRVALGTLKRGMAVPLEQA